MTFNKVPSPAPLTLESVKMQFDHWRSIRARGSKTPKHLWQAVQILTQRYAYEQIAETLNINLYRLRAKLEKQEQQSSSFHFIKYCGSQESQFFGRQQSEMIPSLPVMSPERLQKASIVKLLP